MHRGCTLDSWPCQEQLDNSNSSSSNDKKFNCYAAFCKIALHTTITILPQGRTIQKSTTTYLCTHVSSQNSNKGTGRTKASANASRHQLANLRDEILSQVDSAKSVNIQGRQRANDKDATAIWYGNVVVLRWAHQQDLHTGKCGNDLVMSCESHLLVGSSSQFW